MTQATMKSKTVKESQIVLAQSMGIQDSNLANVVHGGVIMRLVDTAGGLAAIKHAGGLVVTAEIDEMSFLEPVNLGDLVTFRASVNAVGKTSMEVGVRVETENIVTGRVLHTSTAYLVFVALDPATRKPRPVPQLVAETDEEKRRMREAQLRREARLSRRAAILAAREQQ